MNFKKLLFTFLLLLTPLFFTIETQAVQSLSFLPSTLQIDSGHRAGDYDLYTTSLMPMTSLQFNGDENVQDCVSVVRINNSDYVNIQGIIHKTGESTYKCTAGLDLTNPYQTEGDYQVKVIIYDKNYQQYSTKYFYTVRVDKTAPTSKVSVERTDMYGLKDVAYFRFTFNDKTWVKFDDIKLFYRKDGGAWKEKIMTRGLSYEYVIAYSTLSSTYSFDGPGVYEFYTLAKDIVGNVEVKSPKADTSIVALSIQSTPNPTNQNQAQQQTATTASEVSTSKNTNNTTQQNVIVTANTTNNSNIESSPTISPTNAVAEATEVESARVASSDIPGNIIAKKGKVVNYLIITASILLLAGIILFIILKRNLKLVRK